MLPSDSTRPKRETKRVAIGGRSLSLTRAGTGAPVVLLDAGLGATSADWEPVLDRLATVTTVCCYDRAGLGASDPRPHWPHTTQDNVDDLHALLVEAALPPPYVLVGHSRAGFTVALYAAQHPDEVDGLVLVDPPHPEDYPAYLEQLLLPTSEEPDHIQRLRHFYAGGYQDPARNSEGLDVAASCRQVQQIRSLSTTLPLIVLTAGGFLREPLLGPELGQRFHQVHGAMGQRWASLSTQGRHLVVEYSNHQMQTEVPEIVIEAIQTVVQQARASHFEAR